MKENSQKLTLGAASRMCGLSKPTLSKYLAQGRISGVKNDTGVWQIDPAEIARLDDMRGAAGKGRTAAPEAAPEGAETALAVEARMLREQVADLKEREGRALAQLETALENERAAARQLAGVLSDQRGGLFQKIVKKFRGQ